MISIFQRHHHGILKIHSLNNDKYTTLDEGKRIIHLTYYSTKSFVWIEEIKSQQKRSVDFPSYLCVCVRTLSKLPSPPPKNKQINAAVVFFLICNLSNIFACIPLPLMHFNYFLYSHLLVYQLVHFTHYPEWNVFHILLISRFCILWLGTL